MQSYFLNKLATLEKIAMKENIITYIKTIVNLPTAEADRFLQILRPVEILKGEYFICEGQVPTKMAFVGKGLFRYLYVDTAGREYTKNFMPEGSFIASYSAMIHKTPSLMHIEALEDSAIYEIPYTEWQTLRNGHPCWNALLVNFLEKGFCVKEKRERELLLLEAEDRYQIFLHDFPALEHRVKQHLIASYLGISPVSLSRIRNKTVNIG
jgi:CRP-like cAMP-binding protein